VFQDDTFLPDDCFKMCGTMELCAICIVSPTRCTAVKQHYGTTINCHYVSQIKYCKREYCFAKSSLILSNQTIANRTIIQLLELKVKRLSREKSFFIFSISH
jgi:hypothetical protein